MKWIYSYQYGCVDQGSFMSCLFCDPAGDNWFLQPNTPCVVDMVLPGLGSGGNDLYVYGFSGALSIGWGTSDVLSTVVPPDDFVAAPVVGDLSDHLSYWCNNPPNEIVPSVNTSVSTYEHIYERTQYPPGPRGQDIHEICFDVL